MFFCILLAVRKVTRLGAACFRAAIRATTSAPRSTESRPARQARKLRTRRFWWRLHLVAHPPVAVPEGAIAERSISLLSAQIPVDISAPRRAVDSGLDSGETGKKRGISRYGTFGPFTLCGRNCTLPLEQTSGEGCSNLIPRF